MGRGLLRLFARVNPLNKLGTICKRVNTIPAAAETKITFKLGVKKPKDENLIFFQPNIKSTGVIQMIGFIINSSVYSGSVMLYR